MPLYDMRLPELQAYRPRQTRESDFDAFWEKTLAQATTLPLRVQITPADYPARLTVSSMYVTMAGTAPVSPRGTSGRMVTGRSPASSSTTATAAREPSRTTTLPGQPRAMLCWRWIHVANQARAQTQRCTAAAMSRAG